MARDTNNTTEINRLNSAVNEFAGEMKEVLSENVITGKRGWDEAMPADLFRHIQDKMRELTVWHTTFLDSPTPEGYEEIARRSIDLANLSMMYRRSLKEVD